jgi:hypothetical protein
LISAHCRERLNTLNAAAEAAIKENVADADPEYARMITLMVASIVCKIADKWCK